VWAAAEQQRWIYFQRHGGGWESLLHEIGPPYDFIFVLYYVIVVRLLFKRYTMFF
jgi:hypothetical protein